MTDPNDVQQLKKRVTELEQQLAEAREEAQWDLKAAKESSDKTIRKLEEDLARVRKGGGAAADSAEIRRLKDQVDFFTQRSLMAERKVADLQMEVAKRSAVSAPPPIP